MSQKHLIIDPDRCIGCARCMNVCIRNNIRLDMGVATETGGDCFDCGHCMATCPHDAIRLTRYEGDEVREYDPGEVLIGSDDMMEFLTRRRSCRWFTGEKVTDEEFATLFEAASTSPSTENSQDVCFAVVDRRMDEFMRLLAEVLNPLSDEYPRIRQFCESVDDPFGMRRNPLLWDGRQVILAFSRFPTDAVIAMSRIEMMAYSMGLGGFYSRWIQMAEEQGHDRLMEFFPQVPDDRHMYCAFVIGRPRIGFRRTVPRDGVTVLRY